MTQNEPLKGWHHNGIRSSLLKSSYDKYLYVYNDHNIIKITSRDKKFGYHHSYDISSIDHRGMVLLNSNEIDSIDNVL